jgi:GTP-binding protein HflX
MLERPDSGDKAVLVSLDFGAPDYADGREELCELAVSAGVRVQGVIEGRRHKPDPAHFAGSGKVDEIQRCVTATGAEVVIFNHELSPAQQRNLERRFDRRVIDRTSLILDIFAQRARSHEGKLQVELAQLQHLATRLTRGWTHLERQKGGIGLRGPGETQLETDRRLIGNRVKVLRDKLDRVRSQREVQRRARQRASVYGVSLVGYTNAGKSTLFNSLTQSSVYAADKLFATLDTTSRRMFIAPRTDVVVSDTVGFIRGLPHTLVAAFRATLEETVQANLLLHVVDASRSGHGEQIEDVDKVLTDIGADGIQQVVIMNKIDLLGIEPRAERDEYGNIWRLWVSARERVGLDLVRRAIEECESRMRESAAVQDGHDAQLLIQHVTE